MKLGILIIRAFLGLTFVIHGWSKISSFSEAMGMVESIGLPTYFTYLLIFIEIFGGILLILGIFTNYISIIHVIILISAVLTVKSNASYIGGYEVDILLIVMYIAVISSYKWNKIIQFN